MTRLNATRPKLDASTGYSIPPHTLSRAMGINGQVSIFPIDALYSNESPESGTFWAMARSRPLPGLLPTTSNGPAARCALPSTRPAGVSAI